MPRPIMIIIEANLLLYLPDCGEWFIAGGNLVDTDLIVYVVQDRLLFRPNLFPWYVRDAR